MTSSPLWYSNSMLSEASSWSSAYAGDLVHFIELTPGEADLVGTIFDVEAGLQGTEGDLTVAMGPDSQRGRAAEVE